MGFLQKFQLGKVVGSAFKGFVSGGSAGALSAALPTALTATVAAASSRASTAQFAQPSASFPSSAGGLPAVQVANRAVATRGTVDQTLFNAGLKVLDKVGIRVLNPNAVVGQLRKVLAGMLRFSRRTPGLTIVSLLANLGLSAMEANHVVSWYATSGKKTRRVRVTNVKALNRSVRRLEGFMRLAKRVENSLAVRAKKSVGRRRCFKCRKSPCSC